MMRKWALVCVFALLLVGLLSGAASDNQTTAAYEEGGGPMSVQDPSRATRGIHETVAYIEGGGPMSVQKPSGSNFAI